MRGAFIHQMYRKRYGARRNDWCYPSFFDFIEMSKIFSKVKYETFGVLGSSGNLLIKMRKSFDLILRKLSQKAGDTSLRVSIKSENILYIAN